MRVLVCGGREFANRQLLNEELNRLRRERGVALVIAGGARGADAMAEWWAKGEGLPCEVYEADWAGLAAKQAQSETSGCSTKASRTSWSLSLVAEARPTWFAEQGSGGRGY
jgi:hypothetical protein